MKSAIWLLGFLATMELTAQTLSSPPAGSPSQSAASPGALAPAPAPTPGALTPAPAPISPSANVSVGAPALATSSSLNAAALTNGLAGFGFTNQFGTNFTSGDLGSVLLNLQVNLQQALALLGNFNGGLSTLATTPPTGSGAANLAQNLAGGGGVNLAQNLAQSVAVPTSPPATPASVFAPPGPSPVPPTALAPPVTSPTNIAGVPLSPAGSNTFTGTTLSFNDSVRRLIILQSDLERLLSQVAAATGTPFILPVGNGTFATNNFGVGAGQLGPVNSSAMTGTTRIPARTTPPRTLTPTGR